MPNDLPLASAVVALLATYLLHSTILLAGAWFLLACGRQQSAALQERLWKLAAIAPLLTAPLQFAGAERFDRWAVVTLPAISWGSAVEPPLVMTSNARPPATAAVASANDVFAIEQDDSAASVEIVPAHRVPIEIADEALPTIEPETDPLVAVPLAMADNSPAAQFEFPAAVDVETDEQAGVTIPLALQPPSVAPTASSDSSAATSSFHKDWRHWLSLSLAALMLAGLSRIAWRSWAARRRLRTVQTLTDGALRSSLDRLLRERGVRRSVRLACSSSTLEPSAGGILHWVVIVPPGLDERLTPAEQHALLAHEVAHLVRHDPLWLWLGTALCWCLPFQALNFLAVRRWRQAAEELSDDWAIAGGVKPLTLANCLTRVAEWRLSPMPVGLTADIGKSRFARRIGRLVSRDPHEDRWSRPARKRLLFAGALGCVALLTCCGPRMQAGSREAVDAISRNPATAEHADQLRPFPEDSAFGPEVTIDPGTLEELRLEENVTDVAAELAALLSDLERMESLLGNTADDPELDDARARLRSRIEQIRQRALPAAPD